MQKHDRYKIKIANWACVPFSSKILQEIHIFERRQVKKRYLLKDDYKQRQIHFDISFCVFQVQHNAESQPRREIIIPHKNY